jgi:tetratricopeptide (TPR) repeat protein
MAQSFSLPDLMEETESMRRQGRRHEALEVVERFLRKNQDHPRALLLKSRVLYELGRLSQAVEVLYTLQRIRRNTGDETLQSLLGAIEQLGGRGQPSIAPAFVTESMARLLTQQGYILEALEVYRRLLEAGPEKKDWHDEIARLKTMVEQEGSRGATQERVAQELEVCDLWLKQRQRGS